MKLQFQYIIRKGELTPASGHPIYDYHHRSVLNDFFENCIKYQDPEFIKLNMNYVSFVYIENEIYVKDSKQLDCIEEDDLDTDIRHKLETNHFVIIGYALIHKEPDSIYHEILSIETRQTLKRRRIASHLISNYNETISDFHLHAAPSHIPKIEECVEFFKYAFPNRMRFDYIDIDPWSYTYEYVKWNEDYDLDPLLYEDVYQILKKMGCKDYSTSEIIKLSSGRVLPSAMLKWLDFDKTLFKWKVKEEFQILILMDTLEKMIYVKESVDMTPDPKLEEWIKYFQSPLFEGEFSSMIIYSSNAFYLKTRNEKRPFLNFYLGENPMHISKDVLRSFEIDSLHNYIISIKLNDEIGKTSDDDLRLSIGKTCEESSDIRGEVILLHKEHNGHKFVLVADEGKWECLMCGYYDGDRIWK